MIIMAFQTLRHLTIPNKYFFLAAGLPILSGKPSDKVDWWLHIPCRLGTTPQMSVDCVYTIFPQYPSPGECLLGPAIAQQAPICECAWGKGMVSTVIKVMENSWKKQFRATNTTQHNTNLLNWGLRECHTNP